MSVDAAWLVVVGATALGCASVGYLVFALVRLIALFRRLGGARPRAPGRAVTVLKPLCGMDPELEINLRSFCEQRHDCFQVIFGVRAPHDPAADCARRVIAEHPELDLELVVDERIIGTNYKISNLANMARHIRHDVVLVADSDMRVDPHYLARVVAPFADPEVGAVTCLYKGAAAAGSASRLGAMFVNDWFLPSVLVSTSFAPVDFCLGATMAVRREVLDAIGGFEALADELADDHVLGQRVHALGRRVLLADEVVENVMGEPDWRALLAHEYRWSRTIRAMAPAGFAAATLTDALPLTAITGVLALGAGAGAPLAFAPFAAAAVIRTVQHVATARALGLRQGATPWLVPARDLLTLAMRIASFFPGRVAWRGHDFHLDGRGRLTASQPGYDCARPHPEC